MKSFHFPVFHFIFQYFKNFREMPSSCNFFHSNFPEFDCYMPFWKEIDPVMKISASCCEVVSCCVDILFIWHCWKLLQVVQSNCNVTSSVVQSPPCKARLTMPYNANCRCDFRGLPSGTNFHLHDQWTDGKAAQRPFQSFHLMQNFAWSMNGWEGCTASLPILSFDTKLENFLSCCCNNLTQLIAQTGCLLKNSDVEK